MAWLTLPDTDRLVVTQVQRPSTMTEHSVPISSTTRPAVVTLKARVPLTPMLYINGHGYGLEYSGSHGPHMPMRFRCGSSSRLKVSAMVSCNSSEPQGVPIGNSFESHYILEADAPFLQTNWNCSWF